MMGGITIVSLNYFSVADILILMVMQYTSSRDRTRSTSLMTLLGGS